jgi:quercetin dioxygenase-like cupin family protein
MTFAMSRWSIGRSLLLAGALAVSMPVLSAVADAGECPAGKTVVAEQGQKPGATTPRGVTDTVLAATDLGQEKVALPGHMFRLRSLVIEPGGEVPWHSHADRPAIIYIVEGEVVEYASTCAVPILHKAGDVAPETHATSHWWKNTGSKPAVLLSADIMHDTKDEHMM